MIEPLMQQIAAFILELDKLKTVTRKIRVRGADRFENPAEHSWQLALLATSLAPFAAGTIDINRVVSMLLVHDVGEIDTGDTSAFVSEGLAERKTGEHAAVKRIFGMLPDAQRDQLLSLWLEFEEEQTPEARFAHSVDRAVPVLLNLANNGQSWREQGITHEQVVRRCQPEIEGGCPALWNYLEARLEDERQRGWFSGAMV